MTSRRIFVTGGTGYLGQRLIPRAISRGHEVRALVRPGSERKLPPGAAPISGDALHHTTWAQHLAPSDTLVHLVGTPRPSPWKGREFQEVDLRSVREAMAVVATAGCVEHIVYVSVAQPAPVMRAYIEARSQGEALVRNTGVPATILRPWYVLGPHHRWPALLVPFYALAERLPSTAEPAARLGLVSVSQMIAALVHAIEHPPAAVRTIDVPAIRQVAGTIDLDAPRAAR